MKKLFKKTHEVILLVDEGNFGATDFANHYAVKGSIIGIKGLDSGVEIKFTTTTPVEKLLLDLYEQFSITHVIDTQYYWKRKNGPIIINDRK